MSLYGALFGGVSGLNAQGSKIAIVSDNIANVNTVGYKASEALFETLVVNSAATVSYQTGGVRAESRMNIDQQGLLLSTATPTDIAVSGAGFFTVNANIDGSGQPLYTRAGSFRQDALGNFLNAQGFYLQGWPLDRDGRLPGEPGNLNTTSFANLDSLETVNIESASGLAQATTVIEIGANLNATEDVFPGKGLSTTMDVSNPINFGIDATSIIAPAEYGLATANGISRGDRFEVVTTNGLNYQYEYGGFTIGRDVLASTPNNIGDGGVTNERALTGAQGLQSTQFVSDGNATYTGILSDHNLISGDTITISATGNAAELPDGTYTVVALSNDSFSFTISPPPGAMPAAGANPAAATIAAGTMLSWSPFDASGVIFDATSANEAFFGVTGTARFTQPALSFTISTETDTHSFTYTAVSPNALAGQFNNLATLALAINEVSGLTARVAEGRLMVGAEDATQAISFANGEYPQQSFIATQTGIDWITELGLSDVSIGARRFNSLAGLRGLVDADDGLVATLSNPLSNAALEIRVSNPLDTIRFRDVQEENTLNISNETAGDSQYQILGAGPFIGGSDDITVRLSLPFDPANELTVGDLIVIGNETAGLAGLPGVFPSTPGQAFTSAQHMTVTGVNVVANSIDFTIPAALYSGTVTGPFAPADASGAASLSIIGQSNQGSLVGELFGGTTDPIANANIGSLNGVPYTDQDTLGGATPDTAGVGPQDTGVLGPRYDASGSVGQNMASGEITAQFSRNVRIYDALGAGHDIRYSFIKIATNEWAVEVHAIPADDITSALPDGQIAVGTIQFNGDGSLRSVSAGLMGPQDVVWTNGAEPSSITIDWGVNDLGAGATNATSGVGNGGLSQFDADYNVAFVNQNGAPLGMLVGVVIDEDGFVIASYNNGETQNLYRLPLAEFTNPNGLRAITGNAFAETRDSGTVNLRNAGTIGVGDIVGAALEQSNVELSGQLTDLIVAQRIYQSNTRVISATDELLEQLNNI